MNTTFLYLCGPMISIEQIIGKNIAILHSDGLKIYDAIIEELAKSNKAVLSFEKIDHSTTTFLNASLGKVWMNSPESAEKLEILGADDSILEKIEWVKQNALNQARREAREESLREYFENA